MAMFIADILVLLHLIVIGPLAGKVPIIMGAISGFIGVFNSVAGVMVGGVGREATDT